MKKILILLLLILFVCGAAAIAWSYSSTRLTSPAVISIVSGDEALLALEAGDPEKYADFCYIDHSSGKLHLNFSDPGFSSNSNFEWDQLFWVANNSSGNITFTIENVKEQIKYISVGLYETGKHFIHEGKNTGLYHLSSPGERTAIKVAFNIPPDCSEQIAGTISVKAFPTEY